MKKNKYIYILFWLIIACVVLLPTSVRTSPIYNFNYGDYSGNRLANALIVGKYWFKGSIPYKDYFIMAGPLYLLLSAIGWTVASRIGVLIIQVISLTITLYYNYKICNKYIDTKKSILCTLCMLIPFGSLIEGGASSYELCLPLISAGIYYVLNNDSNMKSSILLGLLTGLVICIDLRASFILIAAIIYKIIKNPKSVISIVTMIIPSVLFMLYFISKGAGSDYINGAILYPIQSILMGLGSTTEILHKCIKCALLFPLVISILLAYKKHDEHILFYLLVVIFSGIILVCGENEWYYYLSLLPTIPLGISLILSNNKSIVLSIVSLVVICGICASPLKNYISYIKDGPNLAYTQFNDSLKDYLAQDSKAKILIIDTDMTFFLENDYQPITKYCVNSTYLSQFDASINETVEHQQSTDKYDLLVIQEKGYEGRDLEYYALVEVFLRTGGSIFIYIPW